MKYLKIRNWDKWQTYRSDRGKPPWIKVHRSLQQDWEWVDLPDYQRGQLVAMWLLASSRDGVIPASPEKVQRLCNMSDIPDLQAFVTLGFLDGDVTMASSVSQEGAPVKLREGKLREVKGSTKEENPLSGKPDEIEALSFLNDQANKKYHPVDSNLKFLSARFKEGHTLESVKQVIVDKCSEWLGTENEKYLRPATLFNAEKFNQYVGQIGTKSEADKKYDDWIKDESVIDGEVISHGQ